MSSSEKENSVKLSIEYPCGKCGSECIDIANKKHALFEDFSVQCDTCDLWYHYVCLKLTGKEPELQENSELPFFCPSCSPKESLVKSKGKCRQSSKVTTLKSNVQFEQVSIKGRDPLKHQLVS